MIVTTAQLFKVAYGRFAIGAYHIKMWSRHIESS